MKRAIALLSVCTVVLAAPALGFARSEFNRNGSAQVIEYPSTNVALQEKIARLKSAMAQDGRSTEELAKLQRYLREAENLLRDLQKPGR